MRRGLSHNLVDLLVGRSTTFQLMQFKLMKLKRKMFKLMKLINNI